MSEVKRVLNKNIIMSVVEEQRNPKGVAGYKCVAYRDDEPICGYRQKMFNPGNFKRHLLSCHTAVSKELGFLVSDESPAKKPRVVKLSVDITKNSVLVGTLQLVTGHDLPLRFPDWKGAKTLLQPLWDAAGVKITRSTLTSMLPKAAGIGRQILSEEFCDQKNGKRRVGHLKIDSGSRNGRAVFGINIQYMSDDDNVIVRHLAVHEMVQRQTKENLKEVIEVEMSAVGLVHDQIMVTASDNGHNMVATVEYMRHTMNTTRKDGTVPLSTVLEKDNMVLLSHSDNNAYEEESSDDDEDEGHNHTLDLDESRDEATDDFEDGLEGCEETAITDESDDDSFNMLETVRCGAHTAQLAVWDVIKPYKPRLSKINKICIQMRHKVFHQHFVVHKVPKPPKVCETRWNVWYILLKYISTLKNSPFLDILKSQDACLDFARHWIFVEKFCSAFEPMYLLTLKLQKTHVPLSQFYTDWLICQAQLNALKKRNTLAFKLLGAMEQRIKKLSQCMVFKACLYIDPRFNFAGSRRMTNEDKDEVQKYLVSLNKRLDKLSGVKNDNVEDNAPFQESSDFVEDYLIDFFEEDNNLSVPDREFNDSLLGEMVKLESRMKVNITANAVTSVSKPSQNKSTSDNQILPSTSKGPTATTASPVFDIIEYWKKRKFNNPKMYPLARIILSAPSTQVTVERLFSQLKFVMTDSRMRLSDISIRDLMFLKMNQDLLPKIVDMMDIDEL